MSSNYDIHICMKVINDYTYHWHDDLTIIMVVAGEIKLRVWARDNTLTVGDILVLNSGEIHKLTDMTKGNLIVTISFSRNFCLNACKEFRESVIICNSSLYCNSNFEKYYELQKKLKRLINEYGKYLYNSDVKDKAEDIIKYLCYNFDYISVGERQKRFSEYIIARNKMLYRKVFLENGELNDMSLKELASYLGINYVYLRSDIRDRYGHGFSWLKYTIMTENAARMMLSTKKRIIDVSNQCGFSDQKYLRKYFKKFYECNPSEFRKQYKENIEQLGFIEIPLKSNFTYISR